MPPDPITDLIQQLVEAEASSRCPQQWLELARLYAAAEQHAPLDHRLPANRGNALWLADRAEDALRACWRAAQLAPSDPVVLRGLGNVQLDLNAFELAEQAYARSTALQPAALTSWNHSQVLIGLERYAEGYRLAEQRWQIPDHRPWRDPRIQGVSAPSQLREPLLIWTEQGYGDTLQHLRWLGPLLACRVACGNPVVLEVEPNLMPMLRDALLPQLPGCVLQAKPIEGPAPWHGRHLSLLSLPCLLGDAPQPPGSRWLQSPRWMPERPWPHTAAKIGVVWAAGKKLEDPVTAREYHRRSLDGTSLGQLLEGLSELGCLVTLLQFGEDRGQADPWCHRVADVLPASADFAATAALVASLDLVISVDTAMAHLVGAMQRRGWLLLPHASAPRWLRARSDTPWYPTLRLFRQPRPGDWSGLIAALLQHLQRELQGS